MSKFGCALTLHLPSRGRQTDQPQWRLPHIPPPQRPLPGPSRLCSASHRAWAAGKPPWTGTVTTYRPFASHLSVQERQVSRAKQCTSYWLSGRLRVSNPKTCTYVACHDSCTLHIAAHATHLMHKNCHSGRVSITLSLGTWVTYSNLLCFAPERGPWQSNADIDHVHARHRCSMADVQGPIQGSALMLGYASPLKTEHSSDGGA